MNMIKEGSVKINVNTPEVVSKDMGVFYNHVMKHNRDISILLINSIDNKDMQISLPLSGSGMRGIRFLKELKKDKIKNITFNDYSTESVRAIRKNLLSNKIKSNKVVIKNEDANLMLLNSDGFDYIDIDPFGSPNMFIDSSIKRISREGIIAVTATDTAALTGTYTKVCRRKYWAEPKRNELMHEIGLRILIRKVQLIGAQYEKALIPIFSYFKNHYFRIFFRCVKGKKEVDKVIEKHKMIDGAGPLWAGQLCDSRLALEIYKSAIEKFEEDNELIKFLRIIKDESKIKTTGFYDIHSIVKKEKIKRILRKEELLKIIKKKGYKSSETHFSGTGIRSDITYEEIIKIL